MTDPAPTYRQLLDEAQELGRLDGRFAAAFEPTGTDVGDRSLGRSPADFARLLWGERPGEPQDRDTGAGQHLGRVAGEVIAAVPGVPADDHRAVRA